MLKRFVFLGAVCCLFLIVFLSACSSDQGNGDESVTPQVQQAQEKNEENSANQPEATTQRIEYDPNDPLGGGTLPLSPEPVKVTMMASSGSLYNPSWTVTDEIFKKTNLDIDLTTYGATYAEKLRLLIATNSLPDIIESIGDYNMMNKLASAKLLLPLDEYLDIMPNFREYLEQNPDTKRNLTAYDGHIYNTPLEGYYAPLGINSAWIYRTDVFEKYGIDPNFSTNTDFYNTLAALKKAVPEAYPMLNRSNAMGLIGRMSAAYNTDVRITYDFSSGTWAYGPTQPNFKELLMFVNKLQNDGLLHPEWFTMSADNVIKIAWDNEYKGGAVLIEAPSWRGQNLPEHTFKYEVFMPPLPDVPGGQQKMRMAGNGSTLTEKRGVSVSSKTENPDTIMKFIDYMFSKEGSDFLAHGIEGVHYTRNAEGGMIPVKGDGSGTHYDYTIGIISTYGFGSAGFTALSLPDARKAPRLVEEKAEAQYMLEDSILPVNPRVNFSEMEADFINAVLPNIQTFMEESAIQFATGKKSFEEWGDYVQQIEDMGISDIVNIYNDAWSR